MGLTIIWASLAYVVLDGFDLGIGILFPGLSVGSERDQAMNSIAPVWDGNETWLVFRGVAFELRWRDARHRALWDVAFSAGSFVAAGTQGMILGAGQRGDPLSRHPVLAALVRVSAHRVYRAGAGPGRPLRLRPFSAALRARTKCCLS